MKWTFLLLLVPTMFADDQEKAAKKALEQQAKTFVTEAKGLEKSGNLLEARTRYANSQSFTDSKEAAQAIKRIDGEIQKRVKAALHSAHALYDKGNYKQAATTLEGAAARLGSSSLFSYNLGLCHQRLGDSATALGHLDQAVISTSDPKRKVRIRQLRTALVTGDLSAIALKADDRSRVDKINQLMDAIGFEATVEEAPASIQQQAETGIPPARRATSSVGNESRKPSQRNVNLCQALDSLKSPRTPSVTFNLAKCAEDNDRLADAAQLFAQYLQLAPSASDADLVRIRISRLNSRAGLPGDQGAKVRRLYASAARSLEVRRYDAALLDYQNAAAEAPQFAAVEWRLGLMYEAMGDLVQARRHFESYRQLEADPAGRNEVNLHLETLELKRAKYDEEVEQASEIISDLLNRAMNLTFNGLEDRASLYKQRARQRAREASKHKVRMVGGFSIPFAYAQQQLAEAAEHLARALVLFPLGAQANQLMALVHLQGNDGPSAMRAFDAVASQNLPVSFYAEMRGRRNKDHAVKCELTRDGLRLILLSSYDKKAKPTAPAKQAGEDGLGDLVVDPLTRRADDDFESVNIKSSDIKKLETKNGHLVLKLANNEDMTISPIYLPAFTPSDGPAGRRFGNNYTRLFIRYPGLEESKLGTEGLTGFEKVKLGYDIANAAYGISTSLNPVGAVSALETFIQISREVRRVAKSLQVTYAAWARTIEDQQELQLGNAFKAIPSEPVKLAFLEDLK